MATTFENVPKHDPLTADITPAGPSMDDWDRYIPPRPPIVPHIRIGTRWINILWAVLPIGLGLIILIAVAQELRQIPAVEAFLQRYPGIAQAQPPVESGFPGWLRWQHFLNMFFMYLIMRAGLQILADHPRLYWNRDRTRGTEWLRFSPSGTGVPLREELLKAGKLETEAIDKIAEACFYLSSDLNAPHRDPSRVARGGAGSERPRHTPDRGIGK